MTYGQFQDLCDMDKMTDFDVATYLIFHKSIRKCQATRSRSLHTDSI